MKSLIAFIFSLVLLPSFLQAEERFSLFSDYGSSAWMMRHAAIEGFDPTPMVIFQNPASVQHLDRFSAAVYRTSYWAGEVPVLGFGLSWRHALGTFSAGYLGTAVSDTQYTGENALSQRIEAINPVLYRQMMAKLSYQKTLSQALSVGFSFNGYLQQLGDSARTSYINSDLGLTYTFFLFQEKAKPKKNEAALWRKKMESLALSQTRLSVPLPSVFIQQELEKKSSGVTATLKSEFDVEKPLREGFKTTLSCVGKNILGFLPVHYSNSTEEKAPIQWVFGSKTTLTPEWDLYAQLKMYALSELWTKGIALSYTPDFVGGILSVSGGYYDYRDANKVFSKLSSGIGLDLGMLRFDLSYETSAFNEQRDQYYFSMGVRL